jgi:hypothetical protein
MKSSVSNVKKTCAVFCSLREIRSARAIKIQMVLGLIAVLVKLQVNVFSYFKHSARAFCSIKPS